MKRVPLMWCLCLCASGTLGCGGPTARDIASMRAARPVDLEKNEFVLLPGDTIVATTSEGTIEIRAEGWPKRSYTWEGVTWSTTLRPRRSRWLGNDLGVYNPEGSGRARGVDGHEGRWIVHGTVEEGQQHFVGRKQAISWLERGHVGLPYIHTSDGIVIGWSEDREHGLFSVDLAQVVIEGDSARGLPGASDSLVRVARWRGK